MKMWRSLTLGSILWLGANAVWAQQDVITIGGSITEIVYALGEQDRLLARDTTSSYPEEATELPDVGYKRRLSAEGVLAFAPTLIITEEGAGPAEVVDILQAASITFVEVPDSHDRAGVVDKIRAVGDALGVPDKAETLATEVDAALLAAETRAATSAGRDVRVLFVLSTRGGRILASGTGTAADGIIRMAGGTNAISEFEGYKALTDEAASAAAPDVILMMDRDSDMSASDAELFAMPALAATPAAEARRVVRMNGLFLLGFGPRTAQAVTDLNRNLFAN